MALISCPECGKEISDKATACPNCVKTHLHTLVLIMLATIICCGFESCKKKVNYIELSNEIQAKRQSLKKKVNNTYCYKFTKSILTSHFSQIDTVIMSKESTASVIGGKLNYKTAEIGKFYAQIKSKGKVTGTINGKKDVYEYDLFYERIDIDEMDSPFLNDYSLTVKDKDGYYALRIFDGKKEDIKEMNEKIKSNSQYDVIVDGIKVSFLSKDDSGGLTSLYYYSDKTLTDGQIKRVAKKIKLKYGYVLFSAKGNSEYAYYLPDEDIIKHRNGNSKMYY